MAKKKQFFGDPDPTNSTGLADSTTTDAESVDVGEEGASTSDDTDVSIPEPEQLKPWLTPRDPSVPLSAVDAAAIDAHEDRVVQHNLAQRRAGLPEALTKKEQDEIP